MTSSTPDGYLLDLDGTLYAGDSAIAGAAETIVRLRRRGTPFRLVTNTTSRSRAILVQRLSRYGFEVKEEEIFTAVLAGAELAREAGYVTVAPFLPASALPDLSSLELAGGSSGRSPVARCQAVLLGDLGEGWSYRLMQEAFEHLLGGAAFLALSRDRYFLQGDRLALDAGPFVAALEYATGRTATVAGKPSPAFFAAAIRSLGIADPGAVAMVGDDLWSDVEGATRAGLRGWLVRTGKFREDAFRESGITPDRVLASVAELP